MNLFFLNNNNFIYKLKKRNIKEEYFLYIQFFFFIYVSFTIQCK